MSKETQKSRKGTDLQECHNIHVSKFLMPEFYSNSSLAKWLNVHVRTKWLWVRVPLQSLKT